MSMSWKLKKLELVSLYFLDKVMPVQILAGNTAPSEERLMQGLRIFSQGGLFEKFFENFQGTDHPNHDWLCENNPNWELPKMVKVILDNLVPPMIHEDWKEKGTFSYFEYKVIYF